MKEELCPIGTIQTFAFECIPPGWLTCDGHPFRIENIQNCIKL
ncbi:MAG: tail fiber protein [Bacteroidaceae bacterium]|nr:tail fiber protein [Bacteroidaceae bacterium]